MAKAFWLRLKLIVGLLLVMTLVNVFNTALDGQLNQFGIIPRSVKSWFHILTAPFIHGSTGHLMNNLVGLSIFGVLCLIRSSRFFLGSSLFIIVVGGVLVWLFGRNASHIGASGWVFGLWSLSIAIGWFDRRFMNIVVALLVLFLYGGMIYGVLPTDPRVSFEAHLFGAIAGVACAFVYIAFSKAGRNKNNKVVA